MRCGGSSVKGVQQQQSSNNDNNNRIKKVCGSEEVKKDFIWRWRDQALLLEDAGA